MSTYSLNYISWEVSVYTLCTQAGIRKNIDQFQFLQTLCALYYFNINNIKDV